MAMPALFFVLALGLAAIGLELAARFLFVARSRDLSRLPQYAERARELVACATSIAIVGNSAAETAIDTAVIQDAFHAHGLPVPCIQVFATDGSGMTTWNALLERYFWSRSLAPGTIVLLGYTFGDEGRTLDVGRLAQFLGDGRTSPRPALESLLTRPQRLDYAMSSRSMALALRRRMTRRFLPPDRDTTSAPATYRALGQVMSAAAEHHALLLLVAAPQREARAPVDSAVAHGATPFINLQAIPGLAAGDFVDQLHLGLRGGITFSRVFAESLLTRESSWEGRQ
jgi:hypothetical protein